MLGKIVKLHKRYGDWSQGRRQVKAEWRRRKVVEEDRQRREKLLAIAARVREKRRASEAAIRGLA